MTIFWHKGNRLIFSGLALMLALSLILSQTNFVQATNKITNGSFALDITGWTSSTAPTPAFDSSGFAGTIINAGQSKASSGGALRMQVSGRNILGTGYMYQTFSVTENSPTVKLSFAWKKNWTTQAPNTQDVRVRIMKQGDPGPSDAWSDITVSNANVWNKVEDLDLSSLFLTPGTYEIQLYANIRSGNNTGATNQVWFDEVYLDVATATDTTPPTFAVSYYSDSNLTAALPVDGNGNPVTKAGTVYVKIAASEALQAAPTLSIEAPGFSNDRANVTTSLVSGNNYRYQWDVVKDSDGNTVISVDGRDSAGNTGNTVTSGSTVSIDTTALAPSLNSASASPGRVDLGWSTAQTDIDHYEVHRSTTQGFAPSGTTLLNGSATGTTYADNGVNQGTTYYYKILAVDKVGNTSVPSNELSVTTPVDTTAPEFAVSYYSDAAMKVPLPVDKAGMPVSKAQTVYINAVASENLKSGTLPTISIAAPGTANDVSPAVNMTLIAGNNYRYTWVVNSGATNDGTATISISGTDPANNTGTYNGSAGVNTQIATPGTPVSTVGQGYVTIIWSTTDTDIINYKLYRSTTSNFTPDDATNLLASLGNVMSYTDTTATYPNTYYYKVRSLDIAGNISPVSAQVSGSPQKVNPHGSYGTNTAMCNQCHNSHNAEGSGLTVQIGSENTCYLCHDAGGQSTYNVATEFGNVSPYAASHHPVPEGAQSCNDCHNPHNNGSDNSRLLQTSTGQTTGNAFCWTCHGTNSTLPTPNGDHQANYPALGSGHNNNTWTAPNGKTPFSPDFDSTAPGSPQIGCEGCHEEHGSSLVKLLRVADWNNDAQTPQSNSVTSSNNKDFCYECHTNAGRADGVAESDNAWLGKTIYDTNAVVQHNGTKNSCTTDCHQPHGSSFDDYLKKSYDQNYSATRTRVYTASDYDDCGQCHNLTALVDPDTAVTPPPTGFLDKTRSLNLHNLHLVGSKAVCKECHDPHGTTSDWNSSGEQLVAFAATTVAKYSLATPKWTDDAVGSSGKGSCNLVCHGTSHNADGTGGAVNATYSGEAASSGEGGSCSSCHGELVTGMARNAGFYTHPIPSDAEDPTAATANCDTFCHAPHSNFKDAANPGGRAANLRTTGGPSATVSTTNKDFDALDTGNGGLCMSCHKNSQDDTLHTQPDGRTGTAPWDTDPITSIKLYRLSGHNYSVTSTITTDNSVFNANCTKCHNDNLSKVYQNGTDNTKLFGLHNSSVPWSISKFNLATNPSNLEEIFCYKCHGTMGATGDYYGTTKVSGDIQSIITSSTTSTHPVQNYTGKHTRFDKITGAGESYQGWLPSTSRHVECGDCHDPHTSYEGDSLTSGTGTPVNKPDAAVYDVEGVIVDAATWTITGITPYAKRDVYVCLKCHSNWAWGSSVPLVPSKYGNETTQRSQQDTRYAGEPADILQEFNPNNIAYHPIFRVGKNQPQANPPLNANWTGAYRRLKSTESGKKYWGGDGTTQYPFGWYEPEGLDSTFTDGWGTKSLMSCSDCHGFGNATSITPEGPHGSSYKWLLKGSDPNVTVTTANGVVRPNTETFWGNPTGAKLTALKANFCLNCHRADVYGPGFAAGNQSPNVLSRYTHHKNGADADSSITNTTSGGNTITPYGCTNCHGGAETGGIHGTNMPAQNAQIAFTDPSGKRFMNGASWTGHDLGTKSTGVACYTTISNNLNTCTKHSGTKGAGVLNYDY